jgi:hypothetical protein
MTYFSESVSLSLTIKFGDFTGTRGNNTHYLYSVCTDTVRSALSHTIQVWGIVYLCQGHAKCLSSNKRTAPHFLFAYSCLNAI